MDTRGQIVGMSNAGKSAREIGRELGISDSTVSYIIRRYKKTGSNENLPRSGRPSILTERDKNHLERAVKLNRFTPLRHIASQLPLNASIDTCRNALKERGMDQYEATKKPYLRPENVRKRKDWCKDIGSWPDEEWNKVIWTDESSLELGLSSRKSRSGARRANVTKLTVSRQISEAGGFRCCSGVVSGRMSLGPWLLCRRGVLIR